jgi:hypothetical protein
VKGRIKALTEKTVANGGTEAEAMAATDILTAGDKRTGWPKSAS